MRNRSENQILKKQMVWVTSVRVVQMHHRRAEQTCERAFTAGPPGKRRRFNVKSSTVQLWTNQTSPTVWAGLSTFLITPLKTKTTQKYFFVHTNIDNKQGRVILSRMLSLQYLTVCTRVESHLEVVSAPRQSVRWSRASTSIRYCPDRARHT